MGNHYLSLAKEENNKLKDSLLLTEIQNRTLSEKHKLVAWFLNDIRTNAPTEDFKYLERMHTKIVVAKLEEHGYLKSEILATEYVLELVYGK